MGFSSNTFKRIVNFDLDGWLATVGGPLEYLDKSIKDLRDYAEKAKKDPNKFVGDYHADLSSNNGFE